MRKKKVFIYPHLCDRGGNLTKKWYVEVSMRNPKTDVMERRRFEKLGCQCINSLTTDSERRDIAAKIIENLTPNSASNYPV
jgi:hypothetical protein